jgi:hypothetical protein
VRYIEDLKARHSELKAFQIQCYKGSIEDEVRVLEELAEELRLKVTLEYLGETPHLA